MRDILEAQRRAGVDIKAIRLTGGATKSRLWNQMQADNYKVPVKILQTSETGALGAALYAGVGAGVYDSYKDAEETAVHIVETYDPDPKNYDAYDGAYERWVKAYESMAGGGFFNHVGS
jgi:xylulokinase